tara:strand:+ start:92 stop:505 length:414 start_codon:yes stop_codon:yes gene_type:complete
MKKAKQIKYGIEITKPWSTEMYDHNEKVGNAVKAEVLDRWLNALQRAETEYNENIDIEENDGYMPEEFYVREYTDVQTEEMRDIQRDITCYGFGMGFSVKDIDEEVKEELENAASYRLKEMAEDMKLELEYEFIGLN